MVLDRNYIERSKNAKLIVEYCENVADEFDIELTKEPYWVLAAKEGALVDDYCKLIIETTTGSVKVGLSREEIENFPTILGNHKDENKIKSKLESLK